jgi:uroporphyrinogen decarboxylase
LNSRDRVWAALRGDASRCVPKGEILVENRWLQKSALPDLHAAIQYLQADLVVLPIVPSPPLVINWREWAQRNSFLFGCLQGPITYLSERQGWHALSRLIIKQPLEAKNIISQFMEQSVQSALKALDQGCEGIVLFDDLAGDKGLLISPKLLQELYFPVMQSVLAQLNCQDVPVIFHSDGNILSLMPLLKKIGFWGIQGLQPALGLDPELFQDMQDWVFWGNFDFEGHGRLKNTGEVQATVVALLNKWTAFPGFIFGSSGGLYAGLSLPEIKKAYHIVENWRRAESLGTRT